MKIEKLSKSNGNKKFIYGLVIGISLIVVINILVSYSKYKIESNIDLAEGTINYVIPDLKLMAIYVKDDKGVFNKRDTVPNDTIYKVIKDNTENSSYCVNQLTGEKLTNVYMKYENGALDIRVTKKGTKCWVYLEKAKLLNKDILTKNTPKETPRDETYKNVGTFTKTATTDEGVFKMTDYDGEDTYYFRGAVPDNYVKFAGFYWRVIRVNSDGSIRMIYDGTSAHANGESSSNRQLDKTSAFNSTYNDAKYVGFMYGTAKVPTEKYDDAHENETKSAILQALEAWYKSNIDNTIYDNYVARNAIFCNDRRSVNNYSDLWSVWLSTPAKQNTGGFGNTSATAYGPRMRAYANGRGGWQETQYADLSCQVDDRFTSSDATKGNKKMSYPVGLITLDEVLMGGGFGGQANDKYYLYTGRSFWAMSPDGFLTGSGHAQGFRVWSDGNLSGYWVSDGYGVRPVINLKASTTVTGSGSQTDPYVVY